MIKFLRDFITLYAPDGVFILSINLNNTLKKRQAVVRLHEKNIYSVHDGNDVIYTCRRSRLGRYFFGIKNQCAALSRDYLLHNIAFKEGDVLVDCGANNGEIGVWAKQKNLNYYAFEPEPLEARCCDLNNYAGEKKAIRKGLWFEKTKIHWHSKPESADSSIIEIQDTDNVVSIETTTLADFVHENTIDRIRLFKLEAEGAEPEVLQGALSVLDRIDYIAVDCGYERGVEKKHTFMEVYTILKDHQFEIAAAEFKRVVFLFKRRDA